MGKACYLEDESIVLHWQLGGSYGVKHDFGSG